MIITAHSGCDGTPDNSIASVRHALSIPADAFEVDVHRRADNTLVIAHDKDSERLYRNCPTLREVFTLAAEHPRCGINCDLKDASLESAVCTLHHTLAPKNPLFLSGTVRPATLAENPTLLRDAVVLLNAEEIVPRFYPRMLRGDATACAREAAAICQTCGVTIVNVCYWCCTEPFLRELRQQGLNVSVWTVNTPDEASHFAAMNVFNLTTRRPTQLLEALH